MYMYLCESESECPPPFFNVRSFSMIYLKLLPAGKLNLNVLFNIHLFIRKVGTKYVINNLLTDRLSLEV